MLNTEQIDSLIKIVTEHKIRYPHSSAHINFYPVYKIDPHNTIHVLNYSSHISKKIMMVLANEGRYNNKIEYQECSLRDTYARIERDNSSKTKTINYFRKKRYAFTTPDKLCVLELETKCDEEDLPYIVNYDYATEYIVDSFSLPSSTYQIIQKDDTTYVHVMGSINCDNSNSIKKSIKSIMSDTKIIDNITKKRTVNRGVEKN